MDREISAQKGRLIMKTLVEQPWVRTALSGMIFISLSLVTLSTPAAAQSSWTACGSNQCLAAPVILKDSSGGPLWSTDFNGGIRGWIPGQGSTSYILQNANGNAANGGVKFSIHTGYDPGTGAEVLTDVMRIDGSGVTIGATTPMLRVSHLDGTITGWIPGQDRAYTISPNNSKFNNGGITLSDDRNGTITEAMRIVSTGAVGIGTANPVHPLQVAGTIGAEEVIVSATGADYVFDKAYQLEPLSGVADYVAANHHLPGIPSAKEVQEKGLSVGEMQTKLLAKIEELTLHMIAQQKKIEELEKALQERAK